MSITVTALAPLTRTNVTKDDHIWKRDSPSPIFDSNNQNASSVGSGIGRSVSVFQKPCCSPPLKHITIQSTQELLENFDPLDVLDSASERSTSSVDTMIMMTTEEERKNNQRIRNSLLHYESNKTRLQQQQQQQHQKQQQQQYHYQQQQQQQYQQQRQKQQQHQQYPKTSASPRSLLASSYSYTRGANSQSTAGVHLQKESIITNSKNDNNVISIPNRPSDISISFTGPEQRYNTSSINTTNNTPKEKPSPLDDGYSTDSHSNTSASTSSPLSSSFSSLSTFEGSYNAHQHNTHFCNSSGPSSSFSFPTHSGIAHPSSSLSSSSTLGNMSRNVIAKGHSLSGNGSRNHQRPPIILAAKRRDQPSHADNSPKDSGPNLEERLRALTTIKEEELSGIGSSGVGVSFGNVSDKITTASTTNRPLSIPSNSNNPSHPTGDYSRHHFSESVPNLTQVQRIPNENIRTNKNPDFSINGFFRAEPVEVIPSPTSPGDNIYMGFSKDKRHLSQLHSSSSNNHPVPPLSSVPNPTSMPQEGNTPSPRLRQNGWDNYTRYFEKDCDIPLRNIASSNGGKFVNSSSDLNDLPDKDINKQINARSSQSNRHEIDHCQMQQRHQQQPQQQYHHQQQQQHNQQHHQHQHQQHQPFQSLPDLAHRPMESDNFPNQFTINRSFNSSSIPTEHQTIQDRQAPMSLPNQDSQNCSRMEIPDHSSLLASHNLNDFRYRQQYPSYDSFPGQQHHHQQEQQQHQQSSHRTNGQHFNQSHIRNQQHLQRTSEDEFISLSRSLSKQYLEQSEMFQQQQQQQHCNQSAQQYNQTREYSDAQFPSTRSENHPFYSEDFPEVQLRHSAMSSSTRSLAGFPDTHPHRYSWQPGSNSDELTHSHRSHQQQQQRQMLGGHPFNLSNASNRISLDLGSIPQIQRQIRATSEMCLQMSKTRHVFASSADIYKLFQGQKKPPTSRPTSRAGSEINLPLSENINLQNSAMTSSSHVNNSGGHKMDRTNFHRHSFHTSSLSQSQLSASQNRITGLHNANRNDEHMKSPRSAPSNSTIPILLTSRPSLRIPSPTSSNTGLSLNPGPMRVDHSIAVPNDWNQVPPDIPNLSIDPDPLQFQRQSSGYSSENELQQIESNARAIRKIKSRDQRSSVTMVASTTINPDQEFRPVNSSLDGGSSTGVEDEVCVTDNEPVYVNQKMIEANSKALENLENRLPSLQSEAPEIPKREPTKMRNKDNTSGLYSSSSLGTSANEIQSLNQQPQHDTNSNQQPLFPALQQHHQQQQPQEQQQQTSYFQSNHYQQPMHPEGEAFTQNQIINLRNKPITIKSYVPVASYSPVNGSGSVGSDNSKAGQIPVSSNKQSQQSPTPQTIISTSTKTKSGKSGPSPLFLNTVPADSSRGITDASLKPRQDSTASVQLSPVDLAQLLEVPFATNIISDENGDRLSTLV